MFLHPQQMEVERNPGMMMFLHPQQMEVERNPGMMMFLHRRNHCQSHEKRNSEERVGDVILSEVSALILLSCPAKQLRICPYCRLHHASQTPAQSAPLAAAEQVSGSFRIFHDQTHGEKECMWRCDNPQCPPEATQRREAGATVGSRIPSGCRPVLRISPQSCAWSQVKEILRGKTT